MKLFAHVLLILMFSCGIVYAGGDKNQSDKGKGKVVIGSESKGKASQPRTGR